MIYTDRDRVINNEWQYFSGYHQWAQWVFNGLSQVISGTPSHDRMSCCQGLVPPQAWQPPSGITFGNDMLPDLLPDWALKRVGKDEGCPMAHSCCETKTYNYGELDPLTQ